MRSPRKWTDEGLRAELAAFLQTFPDPSRWPRATEFEAAGRTALRTAIKDHGGATFWAREMGRSMAPAKSAARTSTSTLARTRQY